MDRGKESGTHVSRTRRTRGEGTLPTRVPGVYLRDTQSQLSPIIVYESVHKTDANEGVGGCIFHLSSYLTGRRR